MDQTTPPQEQTEREAFESWIRTQPRHEGANLRFLALNNAYIDFDVHGSWQAWQGRASMQARAPEVAALQREVAATYNQWCGRDYMHLPLSEAVGAVIGALQREVEELRAVTCQCVQNNARMNAAQMEADELRKLLIDIRAALPALRDNGVAKLYALAIDNALAASKAEVPNGGSLA